jgi:TetR/AcrR family transcriptional repressor of nem operon
MLRGNKWQSLVQAASMLFHRQGFEQTSLADIAAAAEVPLGNVYYYFKTRDELLKAVLEERLAGMRAKGAELEALPTPRERLLGFVAGFAERAEEFTAYGCPMSGLCQETNKLGGEIAAEAAKLLHERFDWVKKQFGAMGFRESQARDYAGRIVGARAGSILLANTFKDTQFIKQEIARLKEWLSALPAVKKGKET